MISKNRSLKQYQGAEVKANGGEVTRHHSEKVETVSKPVNVTAQCLLSVSVSNLGLKHRDLIQTDISSFANLYVFMMSNVSFTKRGIEPYSNTKTLALNQQRTTRKQPVEETDRSLQELEYNLQIYLH